MVLIHYIGGERKITDRYDFWIHGVNTILDWSSAKETIQKGLEPSTYQKGKLEKSDFFVIRDGRGTLIQLKKVVPKDITSYVATIDCYIAIPTATWLADDETDHYHAYLNAHANTIANKNQARIKEVDIIHGSSSIFHLNSPYTNLVGYNALKNLAPDSQHYSFDLPDEQCTLPLLMYLKLGFVTTNEEIWIEGAGAWIEKRT